MRVVAISDTHGHRPVLPEGDLLIHCGDLTSGGTVSECVEELDWLNTQPHSYKILVPGNHDWTFQNHPWALKSSLGNVLCLIDAGTKIGDLCIWGYPWVPKLTSWAFYADKSKLDTQLKMVPAGVHILVTHGPPQGILDSVRSLPAGCEVLTEHIDRIRPLCHVFGHIHEGYGLRTLNGVHHINASTCDKRYDPVNAPVVFDITTEGVTWPGN